MVDGEASAIDPDLVEGLFDIEVYADPQDPPAANDDCSNAVALGDPTGSPVATIPAAGHGSQNNYCADAVGEPQPSQWTADQTVWYTFIAPSTGAVNLDIVSDPLGNLNAIDLQFAVWEASSCSGTWREIKSGEGLLYDIDVDIWCLNPGQTYYLQIDGQTTPLIEPEGEGYFDITLTEIPPIPVAANDTICGAVALGNPWTQQHCKSKTKQELHHSNTGERKRSWNITTTTRDIEKQARVTPQQHGKPESKQEQHHSNTAKQKVNRSCTTATPENKKQTKASQQQHGKSK